MNSGIIRQKFFDFFAHKGHHKVASSSLIPAQDPTLLFTNAGMNQFKDVFLGKEQRSYTRAVSIQKCVRAGGKHNDLDNVGFTKRHLTFFEMMGNFSFGDYFKKEAIEYAWHFLTRELELADDNLHVTVYLTDDQAYDIWHNHIGIPASRIHRLGAKENFWQMGETGPCGPCTEIHIDRGPAYGCVDGGTCGPACDCDRFLEIWNLVFMQFDRQPDGTDKPLKQTGVDTGMGLERLCSVMQNVDSVYQTDLFMPLIQKIEQLTNKKYTQQSPLNQAAFHVLADHIRSSTMIIADGGAPSNEGRGYVLRKIIRRAALFAQKLTDKNIFPELSSTVVAQLKGIYPELEANAQLIYTILESEITKFSANLVRGKAILEKYFQEQAAIKKVTGQQAFKLYDTYGFPLELIQVIAHEQGFSVDTQEFESQMKIQQEQSGKKTTDELAYILPESVTTEFTGYTELHTHATITALIVNNTLTQTVSAGADCWVVTDKSPYFIVGGGQVPDQGTVKIHQTETPLILVRYIGNAIGALIKAPVNLKVGDPITCMVDPVWRTNAMKNHTATHLLQAALIQLFGKHIKQSGSLVHPDYLRFDFTYHENLSASDIQKVEDLVNQKIRDNITVNVEYMSLPQAQKRGALAFFGDKYNPEKVRLIDVDNFSVELCGGTHVRATGDIGVFKIIEMSALSAGHRRITAVTGPRALELFQETFEITKNLSHEFKVQKELIIETIVKHKEELKALQTTIKKLKKQQLLQQIPDLLQKTESLSGSNFLYMHIADSSLEELKELAAQLGNRKTGFYFLTTDNNGKKTFVAFSNEPKINMQQVAAYLKESHGLKGGGSHNFFQGAIEHLDATLEKSLKVFLKELL